MEMSVAEIDKVDKDGWSNIISLFEDSSLFQTWSYGEGRWGAENLSHLVLKKHGEIAAACQTWVFTLPILGVGIAHVKWGPLWKLRGQAKDPEIFHRMIISLKQEYIFKRGLFLRIIPNQAGQDVSMMSAILESEGLKGRRPSDPYRTLILDLWPSLDELRRGLRKDWRYNLNRAEKRRLEVIEGVNNDFFNIFKGLHNEMQSRKKFANFLPLNDLQSIQEDLPDYLKLRIFVCYFEEEPVAGCLISMIGDTAIYLAGATAKQGLCLNSSNLLHWRVVEWLKSSGCRWYDLCGINPDTHPGTSQFKIGLAKKYGRDLVFSEFEFSPNVLTSNIIKAGEALRRLYRKGYKMTTDLPDKIFGKSGNPTKTMS